MFPAAGVAPGSEEVPPWAEEWPFPTSGHGRAWYTGIILKKSFKTLCLTLPHHQKRWQWPSVTHPEPGSRNLPFVLSTDITKFMLCFQQKLDVSKGNSREAISGKMVPKFKESLDHGSSENSSCLYDSYKNSRRNSWNTDMKDHSHLAIIPITYLHLHHWLNEK